jgi:hypothetical protein
MKSKEGNKLINQIKKNIEQVGIEKDTLLSDLQNLRAIAVENSEPAMAKIIRLIYEHIDEYGTFLISIPEDELLDENGELVENETNVDEDEDKLATESLDYVLSLMLENENKFNREELDEYRDLLKNFEE